jgi:hypothetical protein
LTLKLFKNDVRVAMKAQGDLLSGAIQLLKYALVPLLVMMLPATLIYAQLSQWFQQRPLKVGEKTVLTMKLNGDRGGSFPDVGLKRTDAVKTLVGPVRIFSKRQVCWTIEASEKGYHLLVLNVNDQTIEKELAVGDGFMRVSTERSEWSDALLHPGERPFGPDSPVRSIEVDYPERSSWTSGTNYWVIYWFIVSMVAAFCFRRVLKVNV